MKIFTTIVLALTLMTVAARGKYAWTLTRPDINEYLRQLRAAACAARTASHRSVPRLHQTVVGMLVELSVVARVVDVVAEPAELA